MIRRTWRRAAFGAFAAIGVLVSTGAANALTIRVAQESSAGAGDFNANVLGTVTAFSTALTTAQFYQYGSPNAASYNGELNGGPVPVSSLTQIFMVQASDGLSLVVVHDKPHDGTGGSTRTRWNLTGDTSAQMVADDPTEPVVVSAGGTQFDSAKNWLDCCTDGYAIGSIDGNWTLYGQFTTSPVGIFAWQVTDAGGSNVALNLTPGRRVRLSAVPVPAGLALLLSGLGAFAWVGRGRRRAA